jgi:hypothetical protein
MRDQTLTRITALPAAAASSAPAGLDMSVSPRIGPPDGNALFRITCPATPALVDAKTIIWTVEDSADNSTFAAIAGVATHTTTGAGGAGAAAFDITRTIPKTTRRYVRSTAAVLTAGGTNTAVSYTFSVDYHTFL